MASAVTSALIFAAQQADVGGRGDNPDNGTGIITIVVIVALVLLAGAALLFFMNGARARRRSLERRTEAEGGAGGWVGRLWNR